jgi:predicted HTH transcriptional regulator
LNHFSTIGTPFTPPPVSEIYKKRKITNKTIREMFKLSDEGALKELKRLLFLGVIKSEGRGRNIRYLLA